MKNEAKQKKNTVSLFAVAVLLLVKYAMVTRVSENAGFAARSVIAAVVSASAFAVLVFTYYKQTSGFSENCKYAAIMLVADPLLFSNIFGVWQTLSLISLLVFINLLSRFKTKKSLVAGMALFTAAAIVFNPGGAPGYASLVLFSGLFYGAFCEKEIIRSRKDIAAPVLTCIVSAVLSVCAGSLLRKAFDYMPVYNYIPYERFDFALIKSSLTFNRVFAEPRTAVLAGIPVIVACIYLVYLLKTNKANAKNKEFIFKRKLVYTAFCALFISDIAGYIFFNSKASVSLLVFLPLILILIIKNGRNKAFTQALTELEAKIASYPVLFTAAVIYTAAFFIPFCGSNDIYKYITDFLV